MSRTRTTRNRRAPSPKPSSSDIEVLEGFPQDEGYESAQPSELDLEDAAVEDEAAGEESMDGDGAEPSDDEIDEDGNLKGLIDDGAEDVEEECEEEAGSDEGEGEIVQEQVSRCVLCICVLACH